MNALSQQAIQNTQPATDCNKPQPAATVSNQKDPIYKKTNPQSHDKTGASNEKTL
jgi:hypothetical protein